MMQGEGSAGETPTLPGETPTPTGETPTPTGKTPTLSGDPEALQAAWAEYYEWLRVQN